MEKFIIYINEIQKFEYEQVEVFRFGNYGHEKLLRLPKYNQNTGTYEKHLATIGADCYDSLIFWDNDKIEKAIYRLNEILLQFKKYFEFEERYYHLISQQSDLFHYTTFIVSFKDLFGIIDGVNTIWSNKFSGDYGLITTEFIDDLHDALMFKEASLKFIIEKLEKRLRLSDLQTLPPSPAESLNNKKVEVKKVSSNLEVTEKQRNQAKHYVMNFEGIYKTRKNIKLALIDFESKEIKGFTKKTLERSIKIHYNDDSLTIKSYVERYLSDKLSDKKKSINN